MHLKGCKGGAGYLNGLFCNYSCCLFFFLKRRNGKKSTTYTEQPNVLRCNTIILFNIRSFCQCILSYWKDVLFIFLGTLACTMCIRTNIVFFVYFLFFLGTASLMGADSSPHLPTGDSLNKFIPTSATTLVWQTRRNWQSQLDMCTTYTVRRACPYTGVLQVNRLWRKLTRLFNVKGIIRTLSYGHFSVL